MPRHCSGLAFFCRLNPPRPALVRNTPRSPCPRPRRNCSAFPQRKTLTFLEEDTEVFVEEDVGVEDDCAPGHLPHAVDLSQQILAEAGEELMICLEVRAVDQKRGFGLDLAVVQRSGLEIADQVAGARRRILG